MHNRACCWVCGNCQSNSQSTAVQMNMSILFCMCPDTPPSLIGLKRTHICILHRVELRGGNREYTKRESQQVSQPLLWDQPTTPFWEYTIPCLFNNKDLSAWAVTELLPVCCFESLLWQDKSWEILPAWAIINPPFQIFVMMRQEPREREKPTWQKP